MILFFIVLTNILNSLVTSSIEEKQSNVHLITLMIWLLPSSQLYFTCLSCSFSKHQQHGVLSLPNMCQAHPYLRAFALAVPSGWNIVDLSDLTQMTLSYHAVIFPGLLAK